MGQLDGTQAPRDSHNYAHSDPGHHINHAIRADNFPSPKTQDAKRRMSRTSDDRHEQRGWEDPPGDIQNDGPEHGHQPDITNNTYRDQVSDRTYSEDNRVHLASLGPAASSGSWSRHLALWQQLREKHVHVLNSRISIREGRAALNFRLNTLDDEDAQLLLAMTAALTVFSISTIKDVVDRLQASQTSRQSLRADRDAFEQLEQLLISNEEVLADLETKAFTEISSPIDFPGGFLDFSRDNDLDTASVVSIPTEISPAKEKYDRSLKAVNVIRERLLDMQSQNEQLLRQQEKRKRLGRTLDTFSIQTLQDFDARLASTNREFDLAQAEFVIAEATWTSRRKVIEQEEDESETLQSVAPQESSGVRLDDFYSFHEDAYDSLDLLVEEDERASAIAFKLFQTENEPRLVYDLPSKAENGEIVNQARFISQWLLQQVHQSPAETKRFAKLLAETLPILGPNVLVDSALSCWMQDGTEEEYIANVMKIGQTKAQSLSRTPSGQFARSEDDSK